MSGVLPKCVAISPLFNGVRILSQADRSKPFVRLGFIVDAGSRYESSLERGATHFLRAMCSSSTVGSSLVKMTRHFEHCGAYFSASTTRDSTAYWLDCLPEHTKQLSSLALETVLLPKFYAWEVEDTKPRVQLDVEMRQTDLPLWLSDLTHQASFKGGLSNSLTIDLENLDRFWNSKLKTFHERNFTSDRMTIVAQGLIDEDFIINLGQQIPAAVSEVSEHSSFYPRELRQEFPGTVTLITFAFNASSSSDDKLIQFEVLSELLGSSTVAFNGNQWLQSTLQSSCSHPVTVNCETIPYSDNGIFCTNFCVHAHDAGVAPAVVIGELRQLAAEKGSSALADKLESSKRKVMLRLRSRSTSPLKLANSLAKGDIHRQYFCNSTKCERLLKNITVKDIQHLMESMLDKDKWAYAAVGNLSRLPYKDELC